MPVADILVPNKHQTNQQQRQAIILSNADPIPWHIYAALGVEELRHMTT